MMSGGWEMLGWLGVVAAGTALAVLWLTFEKGFVTRDRVERFASRHHLQVTVANGNQVIRYLATTRRWRAAGLIGGIACSLAAGLPPGELRASFLPIFAGWFAGALVAEARVDHLAFGARRSASLVPRRVGTYLPEMYWRLIPVAGWLSIAASATCLVIGLAGRPTPPWPLAGWAVAGASVTVAARLMQRRVLHRPQPTAATDAIAADDAIRSRSLHVLAGGGATLGGYCVLGQLHVLAATSERLHPLAAVAAFGFYLVPLLGWHVATRPWPIGGRGGTLPVPAAAS